MARYELLRTREHEQVKEYDLDESVERQRALDERERARKKEDKIAKKQAKRDVQEAGRKGAMDEDTMASLGFGAFGSSKK